MHDKQFRIFTVGWEPDFSDFLLAPIAKQAYIDFTHGLVGDASRVLFARQRYPDAKFVALSKAHSEPLPAPDYELLAGLESAGVPTIRSMVQGDRVLRWRPESEALGYATLLARRIRSAVSQAQPDVVLASFDSLHSAIALGVSKSLNIPWVAMAFSVIPDDLSGFCNAMTPNCLLPIKRPVDERLRHAARALMAKVRSREQKVLAYRAPTSLAQWLRQYRQYGKNLLRRRHNAKALGIDRFTYPSVVERASDVLRRSVNRLRLPAAKMAVGIPDTRFVYYPFHMAPESMLDTWSPFYQNQIGFVGQLALAMPADVVFVVKLHFSDPDNYSRKQLQQLMHLPRVQIAHPNAPGRDFVDKAALVIGVQGTSCLEAALLGKPVLIFGDSPYQLFPRTQRAKRPDELAAQIREMLALLPPTDEEIVEAYAAHMARYMPGRINDWNRSIEPEALGNLVDCFRALRAYVDDPTVRSGWYDRPPFSPGDAERR